MGKERIRFIINPKSGNKSKSNIPELIQKHLDHKRYDCEIVYTEYKQHGIKLAEEAIKNHIDVVCAVGGDGSVHEIGTTLVNTKVKLAIIPRGSGNGLANHLGIPKSVKKAVRLINRSKSINMDTVEINGKKFLGVAGIGLDAIIAEKFETTEKRGLKGYINVIFREYFKYKSVSVRAILDDEEFEEEELFICSIANSSEFGNGFIISPHSSVIDGKIEMFRLRKIFLLAVPFVAYRFFTGTIQKSRFCEIVSFKKGTVYISQSAVHLDGEPYQFKSPLEISVQPKSLHIFTGKRVADEV